MNDTIGVVETAAAAIALRYRLLTSEFSTFVLVVVLVIGVVAVEVRYFERELIDYVEGRV